MLKGRCLSAQLLVVVLLGTWVRTAAAQPLLSLRKPTPVAGDQLGFAVAGLGSNVLVGVPNDDTGGIDAGAVYLFHSTTGAVVQIFQKPTPAAGDQFGYSIAAVGSNVLVGAPNDDTGGTDAGAAYLLDG